MVHGLGYQFCRHVEKAQPKTTVMAELAERLLQLIAERDQIHTIDVAKELNIDHQKIVGAVKSLQSLGDVSVKDICDSVQPETSCKVLMKSPRVLANSHTLNSRSIEGQVNLLEVQNTFAYT